MELTDSNFKKSLEGKNARHQDHPVRSRENAANFALR